MKAMAALGGALLLTLVLAAPAAADQPWLWFEGDDSFFDPTPVAYATGWGFECDQPIYYGQRDAWQSLTLWFNKADYPVQTDPNGDPIALPLRGLYERQGFDYFTDKTDGTGRVIEGKYRLTIHSYDFVQVSPTVATWKEKQTGHMWGIHLPAVGQVFHQSGHIHSVVTNGVYEPPFKEVGSGIWDVETLCGYFGYEALPEP
jgi:hypothetical protein